MKVQLAIGLTCIVLACALPRRKRAAYDLPDGAADVVGPIKTSFQCPGDIANEGYFADVDNKCQVFHVCARLGHKIVQTSYFCDGGSAFNQLTLTCGGFVDEQECRQSPDFYYLNQRIGQENVPFLQNEDIQKAAGAKG